ncbi:MAG: two component, sigma54 specific, transcriptional regulator, Fis family [Cyanobacteria bacterium RYN_339]|nr:two component, sigma54 specific, transcriptional regulator, Fis family [Cyanobacteria bacterium RYN_339]
MQDLQAIIRTAEALARAGRRGEARAAFGGAIAATGPGADEPVRLAAARAAHLAGDLASAQEWLQPTTSPLAQAWLAYIRAEADPAHAAEAEGTLLAAAASAEAPHPRQAILWLHGRVALAHGRPVAAAASLAEASALAASAPGLRLDRARALMALGDAAEATRVAGHDDAPLAVELAARALVATAKGDVGGLAELEAAVQCAAGAGNRRLELAVLLEALPGLALLGVDIERRLAQAQGLADALGDGLARARVVAIAAARGTSGGTAARKLERLAVALAAAVAAPDLDGLIRQALAGLVELADAERGFLLLSDGLEWTHEVSLGADAPDAFSSGLAFRVLWAGEPIHLTDVQAEGELDAMASVQALGLRSVLGVPLDDGTGVRGVMLADSRRLHGGLPPAAMPLALALARVVAGALAREEALAPLREARNVDLALRPLIDRLLDDPDLQAVANAARLEFGGERVAVYAGETPVWPAPDTLAEPAQWVQAEGRPLRLVTAEGDALRMLHAAPIRHHGAVIGALVVDGPHDPAAEVPLALLVRLGELAGPLLTRLLDSA